MTAIEMLNNFKDIKNEIKLKATIIDNLNQDLQCSRLDNDIELKTTIQQMQDSTKELFSILEKVISIIEKIDNSTYRAVLYSFYVEGLTREKCGEKLGYTIRHISRLKTKALQSFETHYNAMA